MLGCLYIARGNGSTQLDRGVGYLHQDIINDNSLALYSLY